ncbi:Hypothetical protein PMT_2623 [Prochlorococcus marinus str. MIT 9313]|uniref:Uncharacterized protein n=1 Tax=Prochlorococcus marinus (strain MIT 9313) TaxID=74547 RepID=B9ES10_PROMM|nr:Hypothetical protein PMT_2623 [Prochlorococcus marinus str. MIT 9313]
MPLFGLCNNLHADQLIHIWEQPILAMGRELSATPTEQQTVHQGLSGSTNSSKNP